MLGINAEAGSASFDLAPQTKSGYKKKKGVVSDAQIANTAASGCFLRGAVVGCVFASGEADWKG